MCAQDEIVAITKRRSDFEHRINASGCTVTDFTRYASYEMNLEALRKARAKRLNIRARMHYGHRRILFVLDRATRKFPGDVGLWMQYIEYAKKEKATNVLVRVLTAVLKLHPTKPELWIYAANYAMIENSDMTEARSHMQRGLRFNKQSKHLWLEYAKLEMTFVAKVIARRRLLGIDGAPTEKRIGESAGDDDSMMSLPTVTAEDLDPKIKTDRSLDAMALENIETNPALNGAIPLAVFDTAMKEFSRDLSFASSFFDLLQSFPQLPCCSKLLEHVAQHVLAAAPTSAEALWIGCKLCITGVEPSNEDFPSKLGTLLPTMSEAVEKADDRAHLYTLFVEYMATLYVMPELDVALKKVVFASLQKYAKRAEQEDKTTARLYILWLQVLAQTKGKQADAAAIVKKAQARHPKDASVAKLAENYV